MAGFGHRPAEAEKADPSTAARNARIGLGLFFVYLLVYGGFVLLNAFAPQQTERIVWSGVNLAIVYGFALILFALVLSLAYGWLVRNPAAGSRTGNERQRESGNDKRQGGGASSSSSHGSARDGKERRE